MAKIFDGWRSEKEVIKDLGIKNMGSKEIVFAHLGKDDDYAVLFKRGTHISYTVGFLTDLPEDIEEEIEDINYKDFESMFKSEKWFKKNQVDIKSNFPMKESLVEMLKI
jgi:hypothetical protein